MSDLLHPPVIAKPLDFNDLIAEREMPDENFIEAVFYQFEEDEPLPEDYESGFDAHGRMLF